MTNQNVLNKKVSKFWYIVVLLIMTSTQSFTQSSQIDFLRSTGKIYTVVAVICVIFLGLVFYLVRLDRKVSNLENQIHNESKTT